MSTGQERDFILIAVRADFEPDGTPFHWAKQRGTYYRSEERVRLICRPEVDCNTHQIEAVCLRPNCPVCVRLKADWDIGLWVEQIEIEERQKSEPHQRD